MAPGTSPIETLKTQVTEVQNALNTGNPTRLELQKLRDICDPTNMELLKAQHNAETAKLHTLITTKLDLLNALPTKTLEQQQAIDELQRAANTMSRFGVLQPVSTTGNEWVDALPNWAHKQVSWLQGYARDNPNVTLGVAGVGAALLAYKVFGWLWGGTKSVTSAVVGGAWSLTKNVLWYGGMAFGGYSLYNYVTGNNVSAAPPGTPAAEATPEKIGKLKDALSTEINGLTPGVDILSKSPPLERTIEGVNIKIGGGKILINGKTLQLTAKVQLYPPVPGDTPLTALKLTRVGGNLEIECKPETVIPGVTNKTVPIDPEKLAATIANLAVKPTHEFVAPMPDGTSYGIRASVN